MSTLARLAALTCIATSLAAFVFPSTSAGADVVYDYTGQVMSGTGYYTVDNPLPNEPSYGTFPGYSTTLDGTITLAAPLAPNLSNFPVTPVYVQFGFGNPYDGAGGPLVATGADPSYAGPGIEETNAYTTLTFTTLTFSTDSTGAITGWNLVMAGTPLSYESFTATTTQSGDSSRYLFIEPNFGGVNQYYLNANSTPGSWTEVTPSAAPEIDARGATAGLTLLTGLIAVLGDRRKRRSALASCPAFGLCHE